MQQNAPSKTKDSLSQSELLRYLFGLLFVLLSTSLIISLAALAHAFIKFEPLKERFDLQKSVLDRYRKTLTSDKVSLTTYLKYEDGVVYTRWGQRTCTDGSKSTLIYKGKSQRHLFVLTLL